jgi:ABC-type transporter Mla MlaB component
MNADVSAAMTVMEIDGVFDVSAAKQLARELDEMAYAEVRIDLTRVREFHDFGVALLANTIAGRRAPTTVIGLHEHHLRLLRYLGIDCGSANLSAGVDVA